MIRALIACLCLVLSSSLWAEPKPLWELGLGAVMLYRPDYLSSDEETFFVLPFPEVVYRGQRLKADNKGIKGLFLSSERFELDLSGGGSLPVNSRHNRAREGMDDLDPAFEVGPSLTYKLTLHSPHHITAHLKARSLISVGTSGMHYQGWVANPELRWEYHLHDNIQWGATIESLYGSKEYHGFFHNVDPAFATAERPTYEAGAGYGGTAIAAFIHWQNKNDWKVRMAISYYDLSSVAFNDGPLYRQDNALYLSFALSRVLLKSTTMVP